MSNRHLTYCCPGCLRVKDQQGDGSGDQDWCTMADYLTRHLRPGQDVMFSEFYCTDCSTSYDRLVQYSRMNPSCFL
ncbi:MAG TPA: hypothetical protein VLE25_14045 [Nitrospira sp.]|jgi:hypothetical protein|nr:hypothetical protein [Nitrospira sp.]